MLFVDTFHRHRADSIPLPPALARALALAPGALVSVCTTPGSGALTAELIASPLPFAAWADVWRLRAVFRDVPGVVNRVLSQLDALTIGVLANETVTVDARRHHRLSIVLDAQSYTSPIDGDTHDRRADPQATLRDLEAWLVETTIDDLRLDPAGVPVLRIDRLAELHATFRAHEHPAAPEVAPIHGVASVSRDGAALMLPTDIATWTARQCGDAAAEGLRSLPIAHTDERLLRLFFASRRESPIHLQLVHPDDPSALAVLTGALRRNFNIVCSATGAGAPGTARLDLFLTPNAGVVPDGLTFAEARLCARERLLDALRSSDGAGAPELKTLPSSGDRVEVHLERLPASRAASDRVPDRAARREYLDAKSAELAPRADADSRQRRTIVDAHRRQLQPRAFLSYSFHLAHVGELGRRRLAARGCEVVTGHRPVESKSFRRALCQKICSCHGLVGIWTPDTERGDELSPWLWFEAAVADREAQVPFVLLIDERLRSTQPSAPWEVWKDQHHLFFAPDTLEQELEEASTILQRRMIEA